MKTIISIIILTFTLMGFSQNQRDAFKVKVQGLGCPFCAYGLEKKLKEIKSVKDVEIDMETGLTSFKTASEKQISVNAVLQKVEKAGYTPLELKVTRASGKIEEMEVLKKQSSNKISEVIAELHVQGNCDMCKARIEKAALYVEGVAKAVWNVSTKKLYLKFDKNTTSEFEISKEIANKGHDTHQHVSEELVYESLPVCCLYRKVAP